VVGLPLPLGRILGEVQEESVAVVMGEVAAEVAAAVVLLAVVY